MLASIFQTIDQKKKKLTWQIIVYLLTYFEYVCVCLTRGNYSFIKASIIDDPVQPIEKKWFGTIDLAWTLSQAFPMYVTGRLGDKYNSRQILAFAHFGLGLTHGLFGLLKIVNFVNVYSLVVLQILNGFFQSFIYPNSLAIIHNWFEKGTLISMALWTSNTNVGNALGYINGNNVITIWKTSWAYAFIIVGGCNWFYVILMLLFLIPRPKEVDVVFSEDKAPNQLKDNNHSKSLNDDSQDQIVEQTIVEKLSENYFKWNSCSTPTSDQPLKQIENKNDKYNNPSPETNKENFEISNIQLNLPEDKKQRKTENEKAISFWKAWAIPGVFFYALTYFCVKAVAYGMLFWLPTQLSERQQSDSRSSISQTFEYGELAGTVICSIFLTKFGHKGIFLVVFLLLSFSFSLLMQQININLVWTQILFLLTGIFIGGPYCILPVLSAADLKNSKEIVGNGKAASTLIAIVNASGNVGAAIFQQIIPFLGGFLLLAFGILCICGGCSLIPIIIKDFRENKQKKSESASKKLEVEKDASHK